MVNENIVRYFREGVRGGFNIPLLKQKLLDGGFKKKDIDEAARFVQGNINPVVKKKITPMKKVVMPVRRAPISVRKITEPSREEVKPVAKKVMNGSNGRLGVFSKIGKAFAHPTELFEKTKGEGVFSSLKYLWLISLVPFILGGAAILLFLRTLIDLLIGYVVTLGVPAGTVAFDFSMEETLLIVLGWGIYLFIVTPIILFVMAGIMHLFMKLFKGSGNYADTFRAFVYASTPSVILMVLPLINVFVGIWSFILNIFGLSINHGFSKLRAFLALLVGGLVVGIIGSILVFVVGMFFIPSVPI
ncbi:MAG: Yip1 family protein [archaeon]